MHKKIILDNGIAILDGGDELSRYVMERGLAQDGILHVNCLPLIRAGDWVLDGGAALGDHTASYLAAVGPTGKVFAFEPCQEFYDCLVHNCPTAQNFQKILWHERTSMYINIALTNVGASHVSKSSIGPLSQGPIDTMVLDDLNLPRLDFIKLDLEGAEYFALLGMEKTIMRCRPAIIMEINQAALERLGTNHMAIYQLLDKLKYNYRSIRNETGEYCSNCDILALPNYVANAEETERMSQ